MNLFYARARVPKARIREFLCVLSFLKKDFVCVILCFKPSRNNLNHYGRFLKVFFA
jgi:hypothetical protein